MNLLHVLRSMAYVPRGTGIYQVTILFTGCHELSAKSEHPHSSSFSSKSKLRSCFGDPGADVWCLVSEWRTSIAITGIDIRVVSPRFGVRDVPHSLGLEAASLY